MSAFDEALGAARDTIIEAAEYAKDDLNGMSRDRLSEWLDDLVHEVADEAVPVYNSDIMACANDYRVWSQDCNDFGRPDNLIQAAQWAIYAAIREELGEDSTILDALVDIAESGDEGDGDL